MVGTRRKPLNKYRERGAPQFKDRNIRIKKLRDAGYTQKEIAELFGITPTRVQQILKMEARNEKNGYR